MTNKEWRAREDAHTLAEAEKIKQNPDKLKEAKDATKSIRGVGKGILERIHNIRPRPKINKPTGNRRGINRSGRGVEENPFNVFKKI